ncbi:MAG: Ig-like domain-containing protein, partial [Leucothrix sp.]
APATNITIDALANDSGVGLILNAPNVWSLQGGTVTLSNNKIIYRSKTGFTGSDNIWYTFADAQGRTNSGVINITVASDFYPIATADNFTTARNTAQVLDILANDAASGGIAIDTLFDYTALGGTTSRTADGKVLYTPKSNFTGEDNFWYVMVDGQGRQNSAQVKINVTP